MSRQRHDHQADAKALDFIARRFNFMNAVVGLLLLSIAVFVAGAVLRVPSGVLFGVLIAFFALQICLVVSVVMAIDALEMGIGWVIATILSMFVPILPLIVLLTVNGRAKTILQRGGFDVGFLGAKRRPVGTPQN